MNTPNQPQSGLTRRSFLSRSSIGATGAVMLPGALSQVAFGSAGSSGNRDALITIFLRGAQDGLSAVVPAGDPAYAAVRNTSAGDLVVTPGAGQFLDSANFFGLNPAASDLLSPWQSGQLAIVNQVGLKSNGTRSHFDAMARMETGTPDQNPLGAGWVGRVLSSQDPLSSGLRGASITKLLPRMYAGAPASLPIANPADYSFPAPAPTEALRTQYLNQAYAGITDPILSGAGVTTLEAISQVQSTNTGGYGLGAGYPSSPLGEGLRSIAALLSSSFLDLEAAHVDVGGWDHHSNLGPLSGTFAGMIGDLASSLKAFFEDLDGTGVAYTLVVQTEFGRRIAPNGSAGVDHGKGGLMMVMGPGVNGGGQVIDNGWQQAVQANPSASPLLPANSDEGDLPVEIDYREILGEICIDRLGLTKTQVETEVFPGFSMPVVDWGVTLP